MDAVPTVLGQALFDDLVERYVNPEIARRTAEGRLTAGFVAYRFQVLLPLGRAPEVRLNEEVADSSRCRRWLAERSPEVTR
jgi:hypothetical protein